MKRGSQAQQRKTKGRSALDDQEIILSDELKKELQQSLGLNEDDDINDQVLIVKQKKKQRRDETAYPTVRKGDKAPATSIAQQQSQEKKKKLSARQRKQQKKLQEKQQKESQRKDVLQSLSKSNLTDDQLKFFQSSAKLGQTESKKQQLRRAMMEIKAGLPQSNPTIQLVKEVQAPSTDEFPVAPPIAITTKSTPTSKPKRRRNNKKKQKEGNKPIKVEKKSFFFLSSTADEDDQDKQEEEERQSNKRQKTSSDDEEIERNMMVVEKSDINTDEEQREDKEDEQEEAQSTNGDIDVGGQDQDIYDEQQEEEENEDENGEQVDDENEDEEEDAGDNDENEGEDDGGASSEVEGSDSDAFPYSPPPLILPHEDPSLDHNQKVFNARNIFVQRPEAIEATRKQLPIYMEEQRIMEAIHENPVVIICGETGSGKTTQVPQFLYEAAFGADSIKDNPFPGIIGVTQPRRVAAVSMAARVADELGVRIGQEVGYQIRHDTKTAGDRTKIKFMTDGILLREIQGDFLLKKYSAIILDEAHERNLNTDVLIGLLSRIIKLRNAPPSKHPLKIIIMSATLRVDDFVKNTTLFPIPPPVVKVDARQYEVVVHFNRVTPLQDYVTEAFVKVCKIHNRLPPGGILVFLTGQDEIEDLCRRLKRKFKPMRKEKENAKEDELEAKQQTEQGDINYDLDEEDDEDLELDVNVNDRATTNSSTLVTHQIESQDAAEELDAEKSTVPSDFTKKEEECSVHVLPLYSMLPTSLQMRVFQPIPIGKRLIVVATNVAETSITIPGIKYVVDCGKSKERIFNKTTGMSEFKVGWISQASASQRTGRAGRTGPGHCYRLYSSAVFNDFFPLFSEPEINVIPIEGIVLQMKTMGIENLRTFPFPTPPSTSALKSAIVTLTHLGALELEKEAITSLGRSLAAYPIAPRFAKMLILGKQEGCLPYTVLIVAALAVGNPLLSAPHEEEEESEEDNESKDDYDSMNQDNVEAKAKEKEKEKRRQKRRKIAAAHAVWRHKESDLLTILRAVGAFEFSGATESFCNEKFLHFKTTKEIHDLIDQLAEIINSNSQNKNSLPSNFAKRLKPPTPKQEILLRQIITAGLVDQIAKLVENPENAPYSVTKAHNRRRFTYMPCSASSVAEDTTSIVYIHPSSSLFSGAPCEYVAYKEIITTSRPYMKGVTMIDPSWLSKLAGPSICKLGKPLEMPAPKYEAKQDQLLCYCEPSFGAQSWSLPIAQVPFPECQEKYKFFARFLLEGQVFSSLLPFVPALSSKPLLLTKGWALPKVSALTNQLMNYRIASKKAFSDKIKQQPKFLLTEVLQWIDPSKHKDLIAMWPPTI